MTDDSTTTTDDPTPRSDGPTATRAGFLDRDRDFLALLALATAIGAALRLRGLGSPSLWVDEFFTIARAGGDPLHWANALGYLPTRLSLWLAGADLPAIHLDAIELWPTLGVGERAARAGPCAVGIASIPILAWLARPVAGAGVAGVSALLLALTPWHVYWSQMARFYTTQFLLANAFLLLFARGMQTGSTRCFALAGAAGLCAVATHFTSALALAACLAWLALATWLRIPGPGRRAGFATLCALGAASAALVALRELDTRVPGSLAAFAGEAWDPGLVSNLLGAVLRIEPVTFAVALAWIPAALRRRDPFGTLAAAVALGVPAAVLCLDALFPIGPRYLFASLYAWILLASMWALALVRVAGARSGRLAAAGGLALLLVPAASGAFLYTRDGAGARARWREAFAYVAAHAQPGDAVVSGPGGFQARYYLGRAVARLDAQDPGSLAPGTWVVERARGAQPPAHAAWVEPAARFEIPSRPWSFVLHVGRVARAARGPGAAATRRETPILRHPSSDEQGAMGAQEAPTPQRGPRGSWGRPAARTGGL
jgi:hypothetical protein